MHDATSPATAVASRYLQALARQDWEVVTKCLAPNVRRFGPFGDDFDGAMDYTSFLRETMSSLPGYQMDLDRVTDLSEQRAMVELRETIEVDGGPMVTYECLVFETDAAWLLTEICIYIRQASRGR